MKVVFMHLAFLVSEFLIDEILFAERCSFQTLMEKNKSVESKSVSACNEKKKNQLVPPNAKQA